MCQCIVFKLTKVWGFRVVGLRAQGIDIVRLCCASVSGTQLCDYLDKYCLQSPRDCLAAYLGFTLNPKPYLGFTAQVLEFGIWGSAFRV